LLQLNSKRPRIGSAQRKKTAITAPEAITTVVLTLPLVAATALIQAAML